jgi:hypothetical protein
MVSMITTNVGDYELELPRDEPSNAPLHTLLCPPAAKCRASGPEPVTVSGKPRIPPALQDSHHRSLHLSVKPRGDAQLTYPSARLGYLYRLHRLRLVSPC